MWRLLQFGQGIGTDITVAPYSISNARKGVVAVVASEIYITSDHKFDDLNYNSLSCREESNFFVGNELYYHKLIKHI